MFEVVGNLCKMIGFPSTEERLNSEQSALGTLFPVFGSRSESNHEETDDETDDNDSDSDEALDKNANQTVDTHLVDSPLVTRTGICFTQRLAI